MKRRILSVVVAARNAAKALPELAARVRAQRVSGLVELVVVDRGSKDGTCERAAALADVVLQLGPGAPLADAWNRGLSASRGEVVALLGQDALPADPRWLFHLTAPFANPKVAAAFARRLPRPGFMEEAVSPGPPLWGVGSAADFDALSPEARRRACAFECACAALSRAAWQAHRFEALEGAEGEAWARRVLRAGLFLAHPPAAAVYFGAPARPVAQLVDAARAQRQLARLFGPAPLALPSGVGVRALPRPLGALAGSALARLEARLSFGARG